MSIDVASVSGATAPPPNFAAIAQQKATELFESIDTSKSGTITKAQFEAAFKGKAAPGQTEAQTADAIFAKLDPKGTGSVSKQDFVADMSKAMGAMHAHHHHHDDHAAASSTPGSVAAAPAPGTGTILDVNA